MEGSSMPEGAFRVGIRVPVHRPIPEVVDVACLAEAAGLDTVSMPDSPLLWRDTMTALAMAALRTDRVRLATGVTGFVTRQPTSIASAARMVSELAPGRFRLGIGAGDSSATTTGQPRSRTSDLRHGIGVVQALLAGKPVDVAGTSIELRDPPADHVPIYLASEGPKNMRLAAELADGIITTAALPWRPERAEAAIAEVGRTRPLPRIMQAYVRITDDLEAEARRLKPAIVRSVQLGSGPLLDAAGFDVRVPDHDVLLPDGTDLGHPKDIEMAISVASQWISDEVAVWFAQHVFFFGTAAQVADRLTALAHAGVQEVVCTHGDSFSFPVELIHRLGADVIPRLRAAGV
jgi:5,10-methylenetetrahydromethanopterin reductase